MQNGWSMLQLESAMALRRRAADEIPSTLEGASQQAAVMTAT